MSTTLHLPSGRKIRTSSGCRYLLISDDPARGAPRILKRSTLHLAKLCELSYRYSSTIIIDQVDKVEIDRRTRRPKVAA